MYMQVVVVNDKTGQIIFVESATSYDNSDAFIKYVFLYFIYNSKEQSETLF